MPGLDGTGPYGNGQPGRGLGPCDTSNENKEQDSVNFPRRRRRRRGQR